MVSDQFRRDLATFIRILVIALTVGFLCFVAAHAQVKCKTDSTKVVSFDSTSRVYGTQVHAAEELRAGIQNLEERFQKSFTPEQRGIILEQAKLTGRLELLQILVFPDSTIRVKK
jgi:hypothetical protein